MISIAMMIIIIVLDIRAAAALFLPLPLAFCKVCIKLPVLLTYRLHRIPAFIGNQYIGLLYVPMIRGK